MPKPQLNLPSPDNIEINYQFGGALAGALLSGLEDKKDEKEGLRDRMNDCACNPKELIEDAEDYEVEAWVKKVASMKKFVEEHGEEPMNGTANHTMWWLKAMKFKLYKIKEFLSKHKDVLEGAARRCVMSGLKEKMDDDEMEMEEMEAGKNGTYTKEEWKLKVLGLKFMMLKKYVMSKKAAFALLAGCKTDKLDEMQEMFEEKMEELEEKLAEMKEQGKPRVEIGLMKLKKMTYYMIKFLYAHQAVFKLPKMCFAEM